MVWGPLLLYQDPFKALIPRSVRVSRVEAVHRNAVQSSSVEFPVYSIDQKGSYRSEDRPDHEERFPKCSSSSY